MSFWLDLKKAMEKTLAGLKPAPPPPPRIVLKPSERAIGWARQLADPKATPADLKQLTQVIALLERTSHGCEDIDLALAKAVRVTFDMRTGGAGFNGAGNVVRLNRVSAPVRSALMLIHELTHARAFHGGRSRVDIRKVTREQWAETIVGEESQTYFREAIVGRQLLHRARARRDPEYIQHFTDHSMQMWFALVHAVPYAQRPSEAILAADKALTAEKLGELYRYAQPYFRNYVEAYRVPEFIKWDVAHKRRPALSQPESQGVLSAAFEKQEREDKGRAFPMRSPQAPRVPPGAVA